MVNDIANEMSLSGSDDEIEIPLEDFSDILGPDDVTKIKQDARSSTDHYENLAEHIDDQDYLTQLGSDVIERFDRDKMTRTPLETTLEEGFKTLNKSATGGDNLPFDGACGIVHPLIRENAVKYQSKFCKALLPAQGPFQMDIKRPEIEGIEQRAAVYTKSLNRIAREEMNFSGEQARLFLYMSLAGTAFKKVYMDPHTGYPQSDFVRLEDFVVSDLAKDLKSAETYTHVILRSKNELRKDIDTGLYLDIEDQLSDGQVDEDSLAQASKQAFDENDIAPETLVHTLYEQYVDLDLGEYDPATGDIPYALPYIITVDKHSQKVIAIRRNWDPEDVHRNKIINFFDYTMVPSIGFYGQGLFHLLGDFQQTLTAITRSLVDSASFANLQAGFKRKGLRWKGPNEPLKPGEFRDIELLDNTKLSEVIMPLVFKEPSQTLFELQRALTADGQKFADNLEQVVNDSANYGKVGTTMALLEESSQFFASIFARVYGQMQRELCYIAKLCKDHLGQEFESDVDGDGNVELTPASDPNYPTRSHRIQLAQAKLNMATQAPNVHNMREAYKTFYEALGEPAELINKILPEPQQAQPQDPMTDIIAASNGLPIKAFEGQDHDAHIQVKSSFVQDPSHQNDLMMPTLNALQANIKEHVVLKYVEQMKGVMGAEQAGSEVAQAQAAQQVLQANTFIAQQAAEGGGDPLMVAAQADALKAKTDAEVAKHDMKVKGVDIILKAAKIDLERQKETNRAVEAVGKLKLEEKKVKTKVGTDLLNLAQNGVHKAQDHEIKKKQADKPTPKKPT